MRWSELQKGKIYSNAKNKHRRVIDVFDGKVKYNKIEHGEEVGVSQTVGIAWFIKWIKGV